MAMEDSGSMMSPADIAALTKGNGFGDGNGLSWLVLIILFFGFMGGGFGWNRNGDFGQYATAASQQDILFGQHFGQINDRLTNIGNGICSLGYDMQGNICQLGKDVALGQANLQLQASNNTYALSNQLSNCCCENRLASAQLGAQIDKQTCDINANIDAKFAELQKGQLEQTIAAQAQRINQLELAQQMCGVVRYPMTYAYSAGASPFCSAPCPGSAI
nr:MAG TPA: hypothetical protein [Bacteriophage sp.]